MLLNADTALSSSKVLLVPYSTWHVPRYHEWMQDEEIQQATASEPLTIEEEYAMQQSWRQDADKLTFIICQSANDSSALSTIANGSEYDSNDKMIGDINLFLRVDDGEDEDSPTPPKIIGEIELMIAEKKNQRRGFGKAGLLVFLRYILEKANGILEEFVTRGVDSGVAEKLRSSADASAAGNGNGLRFECLSVKIGQNNVRSLALFEGVGFVKLSAEPNFFGEFELRRVDLGIEGVLELVESAGVEDYREIGYTRKE